ncbi:hypothetical protein [Demequina maris]|uniref:hypothetical protein n=1 Tax=Demequina maris TaxID=1638982 RepID=UPI00078480F9|nr:hypothetical protein [Demequina maris]
MSESSLVAPAEAVRVAAENRARRRHVAAQLETAATLVATRRDELAELERTLQAERADVGRLEQLSLTRIWAALRGDTADRLAVERAEADAASLAVASAQRRFDSAHREYTKVRREHDGLSGVDRAYTDALAEYESALRAAGGRGAAELTTIAEDLGTAGARRREITEAVGALQDTRQALGRALESLDSAGGWSTYDTFFGGGLVADMVKHFKIDAATEAFTRVNRALERLSVELADIGVSALDGVDISTTLAVFDVLFDNIVSDWMVRDRIAQARSRAYDLRDRLADLADELAAHARDNAAGITALLARREEILTAV